MSGRLIGKTAVITGAASGIGAASAHLFAREGCQLLLVDISADANAKVAEEICATGAVAVAVTADLTNEAAVAKAFQTLTERFGRLDILFNCAGRSTTEDGPVDQLSLEIWDREMSREVRSVLLCSRQGVPMLRKGGGGKIINMSSFAAFRGTVRVHAYSAAKGAIVSLTRAMAGAYAKDRIRVNAIAPGLALTERTRKRITEANIADELSFSWDDYPFAICSPEEMAKVVLFLASDDSSMITGQTIMADGGLTAY